MADDPTRSDTPSGPGAAGALDAEETASGAAMFALEDPRQSDVAALIAALDREMLEVYDEDAMYMTSLNDLAADYVHFLVARYQGHAVGCGALVVKDLDWGELKRMYVRPVARGKGLGRAILDNLLVMARRRDLSHVRLETGLKLEAAVAVYREAGFVECDAFGDYISDDAPESLFMELSLKN